jgi:uncharacterized protein YdaU (DUF1376 family)
LALLLDLHMHQHQLILSRLFGFQGDGEGNKRLKRLRRACDDEHAKDVPSDQQVWRSLAEQQLASVLAAACIARQQAVARVAVSFNPASTREI